MTAIVKPLSLPVQGMTCAGCVSHVEGALKELPGVSGVAVNLGTNKASLAYDPSRVSLSDLTRAIAEVGYSVRVELESSMGVGILDPAWSVDPVDRVGIGKAASAAGSHLEFVFHRHPLIHTLDNDPPS